MHVSTSSATALLPCELADLVSSAAGTVHELCGAATKVLLSWLEVSSPAGSRMPSGDAPIQLRGLPLLSTSPSSLNAHLQSFHKLSTGSTASNNRNE